MTRTRLAGCLGAVALLALTACGSGGPVTVAQAAGGAIPADDGPVVRGEDGRDGADGGGSRGGDGGDATLGDRAEPPCTEPPRYDPQAVFPPEPPERIPPGTIVTVGFRFHPQKVLVERGAKLTIVNCDIAVHTVRTTGHDRQLASFSSPDVMPGESGTVRLPDAAGAYQVHCYYHQSMTATIVVK